MTLDNQINVQIVPVCIYLGVSGLTFVQIGLFFTFYS